MLAQSSLHASDIRIYSSPAKSSSEYLGKDFICYNDQNVYEIYQYNRYAQKSAIQAPPQLTSIIPLVQLCQIKARPPHQYQTLITLASHLGLLTRNFRGDLEGGM
jgi:hypothetical protein